MGIESNKEAMAMMKNALGSIENRFREAYNKGYHDGLEEGVNQTTQKLVREILKDFKVEAKVTPFMGLADDDDGTLPQTDAEDGEDYLRGYNDGYYTRGILDKAGVEIHIDKPRGFTLKSISDTPQTERSE